MTLILLTIFVAFSAISPNFAPSVPMLISTYILEKGDEKVFVRHVKVEQINTQELGETIRECNGPGINGFFIGGMKMNEFKLDWNKCKINDGVDTLKFAIFYTKTANDWKEYEFIVELHNQERIKTDYTFNMNLHEDGVRGKERKEDDDEGGLIEEIAKKRNKVKRNNTEEKVEKGNEGGIGGWQKAEEKKNVQMVGKKTGIEEVQQKEKTNLNMAEDEGKNVMEKELIGWGGNEEKEKPKGVTKQVAKEDDQVNGQKEKYNIVNEKVKEDSKLKGDEKPKDDINQQMSGGMNASERQKLMLSISKFDEWNNKKGETDLTTNNKNNRKTSSSI